MRFLEIQGKPQTFTVSMGLEEAALRLYALRDEGSSFFTYQSRVDVDLKQSAPGIITFRVDKQLWMGCYAVAIGELKPIDSDQIMVRFRTGISRKSLYYMLPLVIFSLFLLFNDNGWGVLLIIAGAISLWWTYYIGARGLETFVPDAFYGPIRAKGF